MSKRNKHFNFEEFFKEFVMNNQAYLERRSHIEQSDDYIKSLCEFLNNNSKISSDMFCYDKSIDQESQNIANNLDIFFDIVDDYASKNMIKNYDSEFGYYYYVSYNNMIMKVGIAHGQGTVVYAVKIEANISNLFEVISYEYILSGIIPSDCTKRLKVCESFKTQLNAFFENSMKVGMSKNQCKKFLEECLNEL